MKDDERGAIAVMTALLMVVVLGMAALVIDMGMLYFERSQLQNGADSAALAIAQDCAYLDSCNPAEAAASTTALAGANANDSKASASVDLSMPYNVTVTTTTLTPNDEPAVQHWFAPFIGVDSTSVGATARASWGSPSRATVFPFTAPKCLFEQTPSDQEIWITVNSTCTDTSGKTLPGAFGWLEEDGRKSCRTSVDINKVIEGDPGKSSHQNCDIDNTTILLPVYVEKSGRGNNVEYVVDGFAAFYVTAHSWPSEKHPEQSAAGIRGKFITLVSLEDLQSFGVEELGGDPLNAFFVTLSQ